MGLRGLRSRVFPVEAGETRLLFRVALANLLLVAGITIARNVRDSLFLKQFGPGALPYMYATAPMLVIVCSYLYTRLALRLNRVHFLDATYVLYMALVVASHTMMGIGALWYYPALYMVVQAVWVLVTMQFWSLAGERFHIRQAKRLFPFITAGGLLGLTVAGIGVPSLVRLLGTTHLLLVWVPLMLATWVLLRGIVAPVPPAAEAKGSDAPESPKAPSPGWTDQLREGWDLMHRLPLLRAVVGISIAAPLVFVLIDFQFNSVLHATYHTEDELTSFLGTFRGWAGLVSLAVQVLITPWLISRHGIGAGILMHPLLVLAGSSTMVAWLGYYSAVGTKFADQVMLSTLQESSLQLVFNPLASAERGRIRALLDGYVRPLMSGTAGFLLIGVVAFGLGTRTVAVAVLLLTVFWLISAWRVGGAYVHALVTNLGGHNAPQRLSATEALARLRDRETLALLTGAVRHATPEQAVITVQCLEHFGRPEAHRVIAKLAAHSDPRVRATAVAALGRLHHPALDLLIPTLLADADERVRANTLEAMLPEWASRHRTVIERCLNDPAPRPRANAVRLLAGLVEPQAAAAAAAGAAAGTESAAPSSRLFEVAAEMCASPDAGTRAAGAFALGAFGAPAAEPVLLEMLKSPAGAPWRQELRTLAEVGGVTAVEPVLRASRHEPARREAHRTIRRMYSRQPDDVLSLLLVIAGVPEKAALRPEVLMALGRIGDPAALPVLAQSLGTHDLYVRHRALAGIERITEQHPATPQVIAAVRSLVESEIAELRNARSNARVASAIGAGGGVLLEVAFLAEARYIERRIFRGLRILLDRAAVASIARRLAVAPRDAETQRQRANALEALEHLAGAELGHPLIRLLEGETPLPESLPALRDVLSAGAAHRVALVRGATAAAIGAADLLDHADLLSPLRHSTVPAVREAAIYSIYRLALSAGDTSGARLIAEQAAADVHPLVRRAAWHLLDGSFMLLTVEKVLFLKSVSLFASLEAEELAGLAEIASEQELPAGSVVFRENDDAHNLYVIVTGRVKIFRGANGREVRLAEMGARECFGEMALLDDEPRSATVETLEPCRFLKIRGDDFRELVIDRPGISLEIMRLLSRRLRQASVVPEPQASLSVPALPSY